MFILRAIFWIAVLAFLLPTASPESYQSSAALSGAPDGYSAVPAAYVEEEDPAGFSAQETPSADKFAQAVRLAQAAGQAVQDLMEFCERNPRVCETAADTAYFVKTQATYYGSHGLDWLSGVMDAHQDGPSVTWQRIEAGERPLPMARPARL